MTLNEYKQLKESAEVAEAKKLTAGKQFKNLSTTEKDRLLETLCKMFNLI